MPAKPIVVVRPRIRVAWKREIALGPGKVELLEAIRETGTIAAAAGRLGMSYMRAWTLIQTMNRCFAAPVVQAARGGRRRGAATLTDTGREAVALYRRMESDSLVALDPHWKKLKHLLRT